MGDLKTPRLTNLWTKVLDGDQGEWLSKVVLESTQPFAHQAHASNGRVVITARDVSLNMPAGPIPVHDGLLKALQVQPDGEGQVRLEIELEHPAGFQAKASAGLPFRLAISFDRAYITDLFQGRTFVVDPGHGGSDYGGRGPMGSLEKEAVMPIALHLDKILRRAGATSILTRNADRFLSLEERVGLARQAGAEFYIGIHARFSEDESAAGAATLFSPESPGSALLARHVQERLTGKLHLGDQGVLPKPALSAFGAILAIEVEAMTINNVVEEIFLRGESVRRRAAEGIFSGLKDYLSRQGQKSEGEAS